MVSSIKAGWRAFPDGEFIVATTEGYDLFDSILQTEKIPVLKIPFPSRFGPEALIPNDGHFSRLGNQIVAEDLITALKEGGFVKGAL